ncbi:MAG: adenylosuccinate synthetase [Oscillospiraceae bacterium]|nr:adenylosuccinate synthetase [Oscillospiraceae bacterium]
MAVRIVIGKNFGDEGKGLAVDFFAGQAQKRGEKCLVIRHNGGAQAGHTVDLPHKRFVFHQLSAGSFRQADTLWATHFLPDLFKLEEEIQDFADISGYIPNIFALESCRCVIIDDVLVNMALEESRGDARHGSCGMGINEAVVRSENPAFRLTLGEAANLSADALARHLADIRERYVTERLRTFSLNIDNLGIYGELLKDSNVIRNAAEAMCQHIQRIQIIRDPVPLLRHYGQIIFEGAQGLLLDSERLEFAPHLTSSRTGIQYPREFCNAYLPEEMPEVVYVSRTYVTRHGAGPFPFEGGLENYHISDQTNQPNPWQGALRFGTHGNPDDFFRPIYEELGQSSFSLMLTHCNETEGKILFSDWDMDIHDFSRDAIANRSADAVYLSYSPFSEEIRTYERLCPSVSMKRK